MKAVKASELNKEDDLQVISVSIPQQQTRSGQTVWTVEIEAKLAKICKLLQLRVTITNEFFTCYGDSVEFTTHNSGTKAQPAIKHASIPPAQGSGFESISKVGTAPQQNNDCHDSSSSLSSSSPSNSSPLSQSPGSLFGHHQPITPPMDENNGVTLSKKRRVSDSPPRMPSGIVASFVSFWHFNMQELFNDNYNMVQREEQKEQRSLYLAALMLMGL